MYRTHSRLYIFNTLNDVEVHSSLFYFRLHIYVSTKTSIGRNWCIKTGSKIYFLLKYLSNFLLYVHCTYMYYRSLKTVEILCVA